jgi:hypothetical protein
MQIAAGMQFGELWYHGCKFPWLVPRMARFGRDYIVLPVPIAFKIVLILVPLSLGLTTETSVGLSITGITTGLS